MHLLLGWLHRQMLLIVRMQRLRGCKIDLHLIGTTPAILISVSIIMPLPIRKVKPTIFQHQFLYFVGVA
jgi:hypothetical protein